MTKQKSIHIRWLLAHEPIELFLRAARRFAKEVSEKTRGAVRVEPMTISEYSERFNRGRPLKRSDLLELLESGRIEMSQMYTVSLAKHCENFRVLDLPFFFRDHEHAARVLDGQIGKELFAELAATSNIKGLSFTYSGGYRMIAATKALRTVADFQGMRIRVAKSPVAEATFKAVGAIPVPMELEDATAALGRGLVDGGESTYPRFYAMKQNEVSTVINDTRHSLFLTSIIMNQEFWNGLPSELQALFTEAALATAKEERKESVADIALTQERCRKDGIGLVSLSREEEARFRHATRPVTAQFAQSFSVGLVERILSA